MTDITDKLASLGDDLAGPASEDAISADLTRGRSALHRNRMRTGSVMSLTVLAVAGTVGYFAASSSGPAAKHPQVGQTHIQITATRHPKNGTKPSTPKIMLVDYVGQQPEGFKVASVPQGFNLETQADNANSFILSPPSGDKDPSSFVGKLVVTAEAGSEYGDWKSFGAPVTISGHEGRIKDDGTATQIWFGVGDGVVVNVQSWDNIGLTEQQVENFADGVTTTSAVQLSHG